jgi:serine/threonine protein kinase
MICSAGVTGSTYSPALTSWAPSGAGSVLHRDLKPANVLVDSSSTRPRPMVLDFGIARDADEVGGSLVTETGQVVGTLAYMSPEQAGGSRDAVGVRSDVYSLGVVLYEVLTGRLPLDVSNLTLANAARRIAEDEPEPPSRYDASLAGDLDTILVKALAKDPARRYASAAELAIDLRSTLADEPIRARPPSRLYRLE